MRQCYSCSSTNISKIVEKNHLFFYCHDCNTKNSRARDVSGEIYTEAVKGLKKHINVGAIVKRKNRILLINRRDYPYGLCFPVGHLKFGESINDALKRKVLEDTSLTITSKKLVFHETFPHQCKDGGELHEWYIYECKTADDLAINTEISDVVWATAGEIKDFNLTLSAKIILGKIGLLYEKNPSQAIMPNVENQCDLKIEESIIQDLPIALIVFNKKNKASFFNKNSAKLLEKIKNENLSDHENLLALIKDLSQKTIKSCTESSQKFKCGGTYYTIIANPLFDQGKIYGVSLIINTPDVSTVSKEKNVLTLQSSLIASSYSGSKVVKIFLKQLFNTPDITSCSLMLVEGEDLKIKFYFSKCPKRKTTSLTTNLKIGQGVAGWVAKNKTLLAIPDTSRDTSFLGAPKKEEKSLLSVPVISNNEVLGVINVHKKTGQYFSEEEVKMVMIVANRVALALENANLYQQIGEKNKLLEKVLNSTTDGIALVTKDLQMPYINNALKKMFGLNEFDNPSFEEFARLSSIKNIDKFVKYLDKSIVTKKMITTEFSFKTKLVNFFDVIFNPIVGKNGHSEGSLVVVNDITKLKNKQATIQKHLDKITSLFKISSLSIDNKEEFLSNILSKTAKILESKSAEIFFFNKKNSYTNIKNTLDNEYKIIKSQIASKDSKEILLNNVKNKLDSKNIQTINRIICSPIKIQGKIAGWLTAVNKTTNYTGDDLKLLGIIASHLSSKIESQRLLKKTEDEGKRVKFIIENTGDGLVVNNARGQSVIYNKAMEQITGFKNYKDYTNGNPDVISRLKQLQKISRENKKETIFREIKIKNADKQDMWLDVTYSFIKNSEGKSFMISVLRDKSKEKLLESQQKEFVYTATHELRTPLTAIKGYISMILDGDAGEVNKKQLLYFSKAYKSTERLTSLVEELLQVSKLQENSVSFEKDHFNTHLLIDDVVADFKHKAMVKKLNLVFNNKNLTSSYAIGDYGKTKQALSNLVDNAIKYTQKGQIIVLSEAKDSNLIISVTDKGVGIAKKDCRKIFDKFYRSPNRETVRAGGTGLGLFIVKNLIEKQGGKVWVESQLNKGSAFYISLPLSDKVYTSNNKYDKKEIVTIEKNKIKTGEKI